MGHRVDEIWSALRDEAEQAIASEPLLGKLMTTRVLAQPSLPACLAAVLSYKLADDDLPQTALASLFDALYAETPDLARQGAADIQAVFERDAATDDYLTTLLYQKGFQALQTHRLAHRLWRSARHLMAATLQSRSAEVFGVDIHPACPVGEGVMFDHATGIVVGETAEIGDNVSILQGVTLGGTGKVNGDRHPKVRHGVLIGAGAIVLGNIEIGCGAQIGAGSVVLDGVAPHTTVVGVPARPVGRPSCPSPSVTMEHGAFERIAQQELLRAERTGSK
ncbi:serine O-acetyltransferase [Halomonas shantousis]